MKNNTKIRLHLSKTLFESIAKEVLAEAKDMSGGAYTEAVKIPKAKVKAGPEMKATNKMRKDGEEAPKQKSKHGKDALMKAKAMLEKRLAEMEIDVAEDDKKIEESKAKKPTLNQLRKKK